MMADSMLIDLQQRSDAWYQARIGKATASHFGEIMAKGRTGQTLAARKNYRADLVLERLTGESQESYQSASMAWGTETEPLARLRYMLVTKNPVEECGFFQHESLQAGASPDGLVGTDGVLEIKCPNTATHIQTLKMRTVPFLYYWQIMGQLWLTGRLWADYVSFDPRLPENASMIIVRMPRYEEDVAELAEQVTLFLREVEEELQFIKEYGR